MDQVELKIFECPLVRDSPTGSRKRKSKPVKRVLEDDSSELDVKPSTVLPVVFEPKCEPIVNQNPKNHLRGIANDSAAAVQLAMGHVKDDDEDTSTIVKSIKQSISSTPEVQEGDVSAVAAITATMDQAELLRKFGEMLGQSPNAIMQAAALQSLMAAAGSSADNGAASNSLLVTPFFSACGDSFSMDSQQAMLQAAMLASSGISIMPNVNGYATPVSATAALQELAGINGIEKKSPSSSIPSMAASPVQSLNLPHTTPAGRSPGKRKLFESIAAGGGFNTKDSMRNAASTISKEERIDLDDLENFAQMFKKQRIKFGFTQGDVGIALGKRYGTDFSQTTISRFEALNLSFKNMCKLRPLLKEWLADAEEAIANGATINDLLDKSGSKSHPRGGPVEVPMISANAGTIVIGGNVIPTSIVLDAATLDGGLDGPSMKRRRKRTNLDSAQRAALDEYFLVNPRPDHDKMTEIANRLELDRDVVRVWFCNRRQKMRRTDDVDMVDSPLIASIKAIQGQAQPNAFDAFTAISQAAAAVSSASSTPPSVVAALMNGSQ